MTRDNYQRSYLTFDLSANVAIIGLHTIRRRIEVEFHMERALDEITLIYMYCRPPDKSV